MNINEYQEKAISTAVYPKKYSIIYPTIGLAGEAGEISEKIVNMMEETTIFSIKDDLNETEHEQYRNDIKKYRGDIALEIGDVLWYLATLANDLNVTLSKCIYIAFGNHYDEFIDAQNNSSIGTSTNLHQCVIHPTLKMFTSVSKISELVKKYVRDSNEHMDDIRKHKICFEIGEVFKHLSCLCFDMQLEISNCADANLEKLFSRKKRDKIKGDGDHR